jgi:hypothetical protein
MKIIVFDNDEDFESYVLQPEYCIKQSNISGGYYYDADFTDCYKNDLTEGVKYCIDCKDSKIRKRGYVTKGAISKRVNNILNYTMDGIVKIYLNAEIINYKKPENI